MSFDDNFGLRKANRDHPLWQEFVNNTRFLTPAQLKNEPYWVGRDMPNGCTRIIISIVRGNRYCAYEANDLYWSILKAVKGTELHGFHDSLSALEASLGDWYPINSPDGEWRNDEYWVDGIWWIKQ